jgi:hypothetical protein
MIGPEGNDSPERQLDVVFFPTYNTSRVKLTDEFELFGLRFPESFVPNFFPLYLRAKIFFGTMSLCMSNLSNGDNTILSCW